jgi:SAM-dependent methyltransferase
MDKEALKPLPACLDSDAAFDALYPLAIQRLAKRHWTPVHVAKLAGAFLAEKGGRILDIGSGVGKFCLAAGCYYPHAHFYGIEQRPHLISHALRAQRELGVTNVSFMQQNFIDTDLAEYNHFYFYNSFYEHLEGVEHIDDKIDFSEERYNDCVEHLYHAMVTMPAGTRVATYHAVLEGIPAGYERVQMLEHGDLVFWVKR